MWLDIGKTPAESPGRIGKNVVMMRHRRDIQGLRALSVILILLFHLDLNGFEAGYIGVDVFMVISGFLITRTLLDSDDRDLFWPFWNRRIRRLLPALVAALVFSVPLAFLSLSPDDLVNFAQATLYTLIYLVNFHLAQAGDYFSTDSAFNYHLHYWSLAVEEQFYLAAPFMIFFLRRSKWFIPLFVATLIASFALGAASALWMKGETYAFYMAPTRAWQFLMGGLVWIMAAHAPRKSAGATVMALAGIGLICASMFVFDKNTLFPGVAALLPVCGAALVLFAGCGTAGPVQRAIGAAPFRQIGDMSYSLYLFHWPVFVFARHFNGEKLLSAGSAPVLLLITFGLAYLSWRFIETPFRKSSIPALGFYRGLTLSCLALVALNLSIVAGSGFPQRIDPKFEIEPTAQDKALGQQLLSCFRRQYVEADQDLCRIGGGGTSDKTVLIWGDSHAAALSHGFARVVSGGVDQTIGGSGGCLPLRVPQHPTPSAEQCDAKNRAVTALLEGQNDVELVILHANWISYFGGRGAGFERRRSDLMETAAFIAQQGIPLVIVAGTPVFGKDPLLRARVRAHFGVEDRFSMARADYDRREQIPRETLQQIATDTGAQVLFPDEIYCDASDCNAWLGDVIQFKDTNHLSHQGARLLAQNILAQTGLIKGALPRAE